MKISIIFTKETLIFLAVIFKVYECKQTTYDVVIYTGSDKLAGTDAQVYMQLFGEYGKTNVINLPKEKEIFEKSKVSRLTVTSDKDVGNIVRVLIGHDNTGSSPAWLLNTLEVTKDGSFPTSMFIAHRWLINMPPATTQLLIERKETALCGTRKNKYQSQSKRKQKHSNQWPWVGTVKINSRKHCAATLVHPKWVVTSAKCASYKSRDVKRSIVVTMGDSHSRRGTRVLIHPDFNAHTLENDMALIELENPVKISNSTNIICIPFENEVVNKKSECYTTGWGDKKESKSIGEVKVVIQKPADCKKETTKDNKNIIWNDGFICVNNVKSSRSVVDIGSPLMCLKKEDKRFHLHGVMSLKKSQYNGRWNVFTKTNDFINWIESQIYSKYVTL